MQRGLAANESKNSLEEKRSNCPRTFDNVQHVYNHVRPHQALDWMTPAEKRAENLGGQLETAA